MCGPMYTSLLLWQGYPWKRHTIPSLCSNWSTLRRCLDCSISAREAYTFTLKTETEGSYETLVTNYQTIRRHITDDFNLNMYRHENTKPHISTETKQPSIHLMWNSEVMKTPRLSEENAENREKWELGGRIQRQLGRSYSISTYIRATFFHCSHTWRILQSITTLQ
jgi:hypothetical protein